jgi:hypothetical protein
MIRPHLPAQLVIFVAGLSIEITVAPRQEGEVSETIAGVIIPDTAVVKAATELVLDPGVLVGHAQVAQPQALTGP